MEFYKELEAILLAQQPKEKFAMFEKFYNCYRENGCDFETSSQPLEFTQPSYAGFMDVVAPQKVPKRGNLTAKEGQINLLHAIAHIEYSAVDLALDAAYRFRGLPKAYYDDWLEVADDEIRHFKMLEEILHSLGGAYGDVAVHNALFEASQKTTQTLLERMAVVPRYLEANGLDATPMILEKLRRLPQTSILEKIIQTLEVILQEEVEHVKKGDVWFRHTCKEQNKPESIFFDIIYKYYPRGFLRPNDLNLKARKEAGFTCTELNKMAQKEVC